MNPIHKGNASQKPVARLGTNFCLDCLINRSSKITEEEEEEEIIAYANKIQNYSNPSLSKIHLNHQVIHLDFKESFVPDNIKEYLNLNLLDSYLSELHDKVLPSCGCCRPT